MFGRKLTPVEAADRVIALLDNSPTDGNVREALNVFQKTLINADKPAKFEGLSKLAKGILVDNQYACVCAATAGRQIELGFDPMSIIEPFQQCIEEHAPVVIEHATIIKAKIDIAEERLAEDDENGVDFDGIIESHLATFPDLRRSWDKLESVYVPLVALYSKNATARLEDHARYDFSVASNLNAGAYWLNKILTTVDNAPLLVIEPETGRGIEARMSGVTSHVQMHILLMDIFPNAERKKRGRYSQADVAIARGQGHANYQDGISTHWNLVNWRGSPEKSGLRPNHIAPHSVWIWHEGKPADIPIFEDKLVVILDPPAMQRSFNWGRDFQHLDADIVIERELSRVEVDTWLGKMHLAAIADR